MTRQQILNLNLIEKNILLVKGKLDQESLQKFGGSRVTYGDEDTAVTKLLTI
jgi:hypothetical protein